MIRYTVGALVLLMHWSVASCIKPHIIHIKLLPTVYYKIYCWKFYVIQSDVTSRKGAQWLSGRVLDSRPKGRGFEPHWHHCVVVLEQDTFILA